MAASGSAFEKPIDTERKAARSAASVADLHLQTCDPEPARHPNRHQGMIDLRLHMGAKFSGTICREWARMESELGSGVDAFPD